MVRKGIMALGKVEVAEPSEWTLFPPRTQLQGKKWPHGLKKEDVFNFHMPSSDQGIFCLGKSRGSTQTLAHLKTSSRTHTSGICSQDTGKVSLAPTVRPQVTLPCVLLVVLGKVRGQSRVTDMTAMEDEVLGKKGRHVVFATNLFSSHPTLCTILILQDLRLQHRCHKLKRW